MNALTTRTGPITAPAMAGLFLLVACGPAEPESSHRFEVEVVDGAEIATTRGGPRFVVPLFALDPLLTLAQDPGQPESLLYRPHDVARGADGNYYVADSGNRRVAVFDAAGQFVRAFGREGQGPAEFAGDLRFAPPFDTEVQVFDGTAQRTQRFAFDGTLIDSVAVPTEGRADSLRREADGSLVFVASPSHREDDLMMSFATIGVIRPGAAAPIAEISTGTMPVMIPSMIETVMRGQAVVAMVMVQIPFSGVPAVFRWKEGVVLVDGLAGQVEWRALNGALERRARIEREPVPVTEPMQDAFAEQFRAARARDAEEGREFPAPMPELWYPETSAWWREAHLDDLGYLWLQDSAQATQTRSGEETRYEILAPDGEFLGHVLLPFTRFRVQDGTILAIDDDPTTDEPRVRVFRLRPTTGFDYSERTN